MVAVEMSNIFDILYNNIMSNIAAPINEYEKSIFLTKALEEITTELIKLFEQSEQAREYLKPLLITANLDTPINNTYPIVVNSTSFVLPINIQHILLELCKLVDVTKPATVKVVSLDMFDHINDNPFKGANNNRVLRIDGFEEGSIIELITNGKEIESYLVKYIKRPYPIILEDFSISYSDNSIEGQTLPLDITPESVSELPASLHYTIVDRAVELAKQSYLGQQTNNQ